MGEGDSDLGEGDAGGDVAYCVEQCRSKECNDEWFGDFGAWLELERPEDKHPDGPNKELKGGEQPWEGEEVERLLVVDVEDDVLKVPEAEDKGQVEGLGLGFVVGV